MNIKELIPGEIYIPKTEQTCHCPCLYQITETGRLQVDKQHGIGWQESELGYNAVQEIDFIKLHHWTPDELTLMRLLPPEWTWIARDKGHQKRPFAVYAYLDEPIWECQTNMFRTKQNRFINLSAYNHIFTSIKPGERYPIQRS